MISLLLGLALAQTPETPAETPADDAPADDAPVVPGADETPADETPAEDAPDDAPATETPDAPAAPEPAPDTGDDDDDDDPDEEIIVYGELAIAKSRDAIVREMSRLGWRGKEKSDGTLVFRGPSGWMGSARFDPELGAFDFRRSALGFRLADYEEPGYTAPPQPADPSGVSNDAPLPSGAGFWLLPRKRKVDGVWQQVREATRDEVTTYQKVVFATAFEERLQGIASRLDALYDNGVPLERSQPPVPQEARLQAIVDFWATRADTKEGLRMTKAVEAWLINRVDTVPPSVVDRAEGQRRDSRAFPVVGG